jgi:hypothetical protein
MMFECFLYLLVIPFNKLAKRFSGCSYSDNIMSAAAKQADWKTFVISSSQQDINWEIRM